MQFAAQRVDDQVVDGVSVKGFGRRAAALFAVAGADDAFAAALVLGHRRHAAAAAAATEEARQQLFRALHGRSLGWGGMLAAQALGVGKDVGGDDTQLGRVGRLMLVGGVGARDASAGFRVLDEAHAVPDDAAVVNRVSQDAGAALRPAVDRRGLPRPAGRAGNRFGIEGVSDLARRTAGYIVGIDAADDIGFGVVDRRLALVERIEAVAVGAAAGKTAGADLGLETAAGFLGIVFAEQLADEAAQADRNRVGGAFVDGDDIDAGKFQPLVDVGQVFHVARQAIERLDDDDVEAAGAGVGQKILQAVAAEDRAAGQGSVGIDGRDRQAFAAGVGAGQGFLIGIGIFILPIG